MKDVKEKGSLDKHNRHKSLKEMLVNITNRELADKDKLAYKTFLTQCSKKEILDAITKVRGYKNYLQILMDCLDQRTLLGSRFWEQEGIFACDLNYGYLDKICNLLENKLSGLVDDPKTTNKDKFRYNFLLAEVYKKRGAYNQAVEHYENALGCDPLKTDQRLRCYLALSNVCFTAYDNEQTYFDKALKYHLLAYELSPKSKAEEHLTVFLSSHGKEELFNQITLFDEKDKEGFLKNALDPQNPIGIRFWKQEGLFPCEMNRGYLKKISDELRSIYQSDIANLANAEIKDQRINELVNLYKLEANHSEVISTINKYKRNDCDALCIKAEAYYQLGNYAEAVQAYKTALDGNPAKIDTIHNQVKTNAKLSARDHKSIIFAIQYYREVSKFNKKYKDQFKTFLESLSKEVIFEAIKKIDDSDLRIDILNNSLDSNTILGQQFWKQRGFWKCSETAGTLKEIKDYIDNTVPDLRRSI